MQTKPTAADLVATRFRQIHLDFHTSPHIPDVGTEFDAEEFAATLADSRVNWVTLFGKCHHGMSYYPTRAGVQHPGLKFDLLGSQIEACKRRGIATPVYISVRVDQHMGLTRPEFHAKLQDGRIWGPAPNQAGWYNLCMNSPDYVDYLAAQTEEVLKGYDADGIFYDMCYYPPDPGCFCERCLARLSTRGKSWSDTEAHRRQTYQITRDYTTRLAQLCRDLRPNATIFFNSRISPTVHRELDILTHLEVESLTTGGWGYLYFPTWARMLRTYDRPMQGMTARFHKSWADFGGLKTEAQLDYEAGTILAAGAVVNVGDQLHPRGRLDKGAYQTIGHMFERIEAAEPWCLNARPLADVAVVMLPDTQEAAESPESSRGAYSIDASIEGAAAMLTALKVQWNGETPDRQRLSQYRLLIIPDRGWLDTETASAIAGFREAGGTVLFSHEATLANGVFALPGSPVQYEGPCPWNPSYMELGSVLGAGLPDSIYVNYRAGSYAEPVEGAERLGEVWQPYFNRSPERFSSHAQTPHDRPTGRPVGAISPDGRCAYLFAAIFRGYREDAFPVYKEMVARLLERLLPEPTIRTGRNVPAALEISALRQDAERRTVAHLVNFQPQRRMAANEYIESSTPTRDVEFGLRCEKAPSRIYLAPQMTPIEGSFNESYCTVVVPSVDSYQLVVFED